jgi:aspartate/methionine/tyrosine aminotransferase
MTFTSSSRAAIAPFLAMEQAREAGRRQAAGESIVRFDVGQPHVGAPEKAIAAADRALRSQTFGYTDALGSDVLREAIARFYAERYRVSLDPHRVVITTGASGAFTLAFLALFNTGDAVALAAPGYPPYRHILTALGMRAANIEAKPENRFHLTPDDLIPGLAGVLVASPANPTGSLLSPERLNALCKATRARNIPLISDEIYHGLTYGQPAHSALEFDDEAIVINSFSKYWAMTGWRVGWLIAPERLIKPLERLAQNLTICAPVPAQAAALAALDAAEECEARRRVYDANRGLLLDALPKLNLAPVSPPDGAFYMLLDVSPYSNDSTHFCERALNEAGVALTQGHDFDDARGHKFVRLAYSRTTEEVALGVDRLTKFIQTSGGTLR